MLLAIFCHDNAKSSIEHNLVFKYDRGNIRSGFLLLLWPCHPDKEICRYGNEPAALSFLEEQIEEYNENKLQKFQRCKNVYKLLICQTACNVHENRVLQRIFAHLKLNAGSSTMIVRCSATFPNHDVLPTVAVCHNLDDIITCTLSSIKNLWPCIATLW